MVRCYWYISILIIIPTIRCCSLTGPLCGWSAVVLSDRRYPSFRNFDSTISIDVIRMKSYMDSLFDPTCVPVRVTINKLNFFPNRKMPRFVSSIAVETSRSTTLRDSIVRQTNKRSSYLSYTMMNNKHIFNDNLQ